MSQSKIFGGPAILSHMNEYLSTDQLNPSPADQQTGEPVYTDKYGKHCMIGQLLVNLGLFCPDFDSEENADMPISDLVATHNLPFTDEAIDLMTTAQHMADEGHAWSKVVSTANAVWS